MMLYVCTYFDPLKYGRPLVTLLYFADSNTWELHKLYVSNTGKSLYDIEQEILHINTVISEHRQIYINDLKQHLCQFKFQNLPVDEFYDSPLVPEQVQPSLIPKTLAGLLQQLKNEPRGEWHKLRAKAAPVYDFMQSKGVLLSYKIQKPTWHMDTYSGRSRMTGISLQGLEPGAQISNVNLDNTFINLDWVSADIRMASLLSQDEALIHSFDNGGDPYSYLADRINVGVSENQLSRDEAKILMFKCLYAMDYTSIVTDVYVGLGKWMRDTADNLARNGFSTSLFGRNFHISDDRDTKSAFNATIQGSVVHAMHSSISKIWELYPDNILLENHDSILMTCKQFDDVKHMISHAVGSMLRPFDNIDFIFPVAVSVGKVYKKWKKVKRYG